MQTEGQNDTDMGKRKQLVGAVTGLPGAAVHQNEGRKGFIGVLLLFWKVFCKFEVTVK